MPVNGKTRKNGKANGKANGKKSNGKANGRSAVGTNGPLNSRWAYAYQLDPPQPELRFAKLKALVRQAQMGATRKGRLWTGRIVVETLITHLLIVTDHPDHAPAINKAIETELKRLDMGFALNGPARLPWRAARVSKSYDSGRPIEKSTGRSR